MRFFKNLLHSLFISGKRIFKENYTYHASALAFSTILSLVPLLSVSLAIFAFSTSFTEFIIYIQSFLVANFLPSSISVVNEYLINFISHTIKLSTFSIIFLLATVISLFLTVRQTMNTIWQHSHADSKRTGIFYWLALMLVTILSSIAIFLAPYMLSSPWISTWLNINVKMYLIFSFSIIINIIIFSILYIFIPNYKIRFLDGLTGAMIAAVLFEATKAGFGFYIDRFSTYGLIYGALAIIPVFLLWVYLSWLIILYGAIFVNVQSEKWNIISKPTTS